MKKGTHNKLFCTGEGDSFKWVVAVDKVAAAKLLGTSVRVADSDDVRHLWNTERLYELTVVQLEEKFQVSRQAIDQWKKKGGSDLLSRSDHLRNEAVERLRAVFDPSKSVREIATEAKVSHYFVVEYAQQQGVTLPSKNRKRPSDEEIIRLAEGRNWRELAQECNISMHTLRHYVYGHPDLAEKVCKLLVHRPTGGPSHGTVNIEELLELYKGGMTAYQCSLHYGVEVVTIIYWLKKLGVR